MANECDSVFSGFRVPLAGVCVFAVFFIEFLRIFLGLNRHLKFPTGKKKGNGWGEIDRIRAPNFRVCLRKRARTFGLLSGTSKEKKNGKSRVLMFFFRIPLLGWQGFAGHVSVINCGVHLKNTWSYWHGLWR